MKGTWKLPKLPARLLLLQAAILLSEVSAHAETRRAVLVGIDVYNPDAAARAELTKNAKPASFPRPAAQGDALYWRFDNLDGSINDVKLMQAALKGIGVTDTIVLQNQEATADAILSALQHNFVDDAQAGDVRIFYYAGHGNHMKNAASKEIGGEDQTIVPADNWRNVPDIRDKEISRILWKAAQKGVRITFIADSCHSGSLTRGAWNAHGKSRSSSGRRGGAGANALRPPEVNDPADIDPRTGEAIDPEKAGVLTLAAAQSNEEAQEVDTEDGPHGAFTWALSHALKYPNEPMERVFQRVVAEMRAGGVPQLPAMGGVGRQTKGFLGQEADPGAGLTIAVESVNGKDIHLRGGTALGLYPGSRLKSVSASAVTLEITATDGISSSIAQIAGGKTAVLKTGDLFTVERWATPANAALRVYLPKPAPKASTLKVAAEIGKLRDDPGIVWLEDATVDRPTHVMSWNGASWILETNPASASPTDLGTSPTLAAVKRFLPAQSKFLFLLPPSPELLAGLRFNEGGGAQVMATLPGRSESTPSGAHYWFSGRWTGSAAEYAWLLPDSTEASVRELAGQAGTRPAGYLPLPLRSDWVPAGSTDAELRAAVASLAEKATRLSRIRAWLTLESPPAQNTFPYHLAFRDVISGEFRESGDLKENEKYKLYLRANPEAVKARGLAARWIYVFAIDHFGKGSLIFPALGHGNDGNHLPYANVGEQPKFEALIPLTGEASEYDFAISEPFGVDTYFLLTSQEPLDNPGVFEFDGLRTRGGTRGLAAADPLSEMLSDMSAGTRGTARPVTPGTWSIEHVSFRSVPVK